MWVKWALQFLIKCMWFFPQYDCPILFSHYPNRLICVAKTNKKTNDSWNLQYDSWNFTYIRWTVFIEHRFGQYIKYSMLYPRNINQNVRNSNGIFWLFELNRHSKISLFSTWAWIHFIVCSNAIKQKWKCFSNRKYCRWWYL